MSDSSSSFISAQLSRLSTCLGSDDQPDSLTRYIGGKNRANQPFISGYHQCYFDLPEKLFGGSEGANASKWLMSTCESFTPHSSNINMIDINGIGQLGASFPSSRTVNREFTLAFREYQKLPILNIIRTWQSLYDPYIGVTGGLTSSEYIPSSYKGKAVIVLLKPTYSSDGVITIDDIEEGYIYDGVFPTNCPEDTVTAADQMTNESVQASVTFKFDGYPINLAFPKAGVQDYIVSLFKDLSYMSGYSQYNSLLGNT